MFSQTDFKRAIHYVGWLDVVGRRTTIRLDGGLRERVIVDVRRPVALARKV